MSPTQQILTSPTLQTPRTTALVVNRVNTCLPITDAVACYCGFEKEVLRVPQNNEYEACGARLRHFQFFAPSNNEGMLSLSVPIAPDNNTAHMCPASSWLLFIPEKFSQKNSLILRSWVQAKCDCRRSLRIWPDRRRTAGPAALRF